MAKLNSGFRLAHVVEQMVGRGALAHTLEHVAPLVGVKIANNKVYTYNQVQNRLQELIQEFTELCEEHCPAQAPAITQQLSNFESQCVFQRQSYRQGVSITDADANGIKVAAAFLPMEAEAKDELKKIKEQIAKTKEAILEYAEDKHMQRFLHEMHKICIEAIEEYELLGPRRLKKRLEEMLGRMFRESLYNPKGKAEVAKAVDKTGVFHLLVLVDAIHAKVEQYKPMLKSVKTLFLGDGGEA